LGRGVHRATTVATPAISQRRDTGDGDVHGLAVRLGGWRRGCVVDARAASEELITINDAAFVTWPEGAKKPKTRQLHNLTGAGAHRSFWGLLFSLLFFVPLLGLPSAPPREHSEARSPMSASTTSSSRRCGAR
jgi:hypothetical protein